MFYAAPVWAQIAKCHIKKFQVSQNKLLKLIFDLFHVLTKIELVENKLDRLFHSYSEYHYIN